MQRTYRLVLLAEILYYDVPRELHINAYITYTETSHRPVYMCIHVDVLSRGRTQRFRGRGFLPLLQKKGIHRWTKNVDGAQSDTYEKEAEQELPAICCWGEERQITQRKTKMSEKIDEWRLIHLFKTFL